MNVWHLRCVRGDYETKVVEGTPSQDQTFSDLNEDFAYYRLHECALEKTIHSINVYDRTFDGKCPVDGSRLEPVKVIPPQKCPKCGSLLLSEQKAPIEVAETEGE